MLRIILVVIFIFVSLMGDGNLMNMILGKKRLYQVVSLCRFVSQKDNFSFERSNSINSHQHSCHYVYYFPVIKVTLYFSQQIFYRCIAQFQKFLLNLFLFHTAQKWSFPLRISSVNATKPAGNGRFGHIYWRNL